ncbi:MULTISPECIES: LLM class flavin-dependent oxidoreductase [Streptomyces]|jgi:5,10-methylenetetrahydromethanopterin reductase|uniref:LLM class flavin-dependent oxidoreductase n=1 Tax=Streptomyces doudnae TaxID=3075536 RepID=A0ABD5EWS7_9ACTN|nr:MULTISPECIES: LLM class flavin-dependent oxidoreductase [unclassified Streptomyces]MDT0438780.1 LLM class flavin-dependent oxidoreductase [Streptomyces sp. DSM 41981]MYQ66587.1 LLM class flavin-dependent oxidoreductase [Streptomyces sp. SID4950]SCE22643.1 5,10-methylenetetrahydromethanopterin reductase [Streptomyces sp. SolWspMP-5a-2]
MKLPLGIHVGERLSLEQTYWQAELADRNGFESVWVAEGRLARDGIVPAAVIASRTDHVKIGTGVVNNKSRNAALMAVTFKTLDELAPGRAILGIGAWWEPLATKVGQPLRKPVASMREYITVLQSFFRNEVVSFDGEFVQMRDVRFDSMYRENRPVDIPIYIGAVGPRMLELAGEISDGVHMDFLLPPSYLVGAREAIARGIAKRTDGRESIDLTQIVSCSVNDDDPQEAIDACKAFLTLYLAQQPHIAEHCGVERELVDRIQERAGWPATPEAIKKAMPLVPNSLVQNVTACGSTDDVFAKLMEYHEAGVRCPIISTLGDKEQTLTRLAQAAKD